MIQLLLFPGVAGILILFLAHSCRHHNLPTLLLLLSGDVLFLLAGRLRPDSSFFDQKGSVPYLGIDMEHLVLILSFLHLLLFLELPQPLHNFVSGFAHIAPLRLVSLQGSSHLRSELLLPHSTRYFVSLFDLHLPLSFLPFLHSLRNQAGVLKCGFDVLSANWLFVLP